MRTWKKVCAAALAAGLASTAAYADTVIRIAYPGWDSAAQEKAVTGLFRAYEEKNPGVSIELVSIPFPVMKQQLVVALRSGDAPDVGYIDGRWIPEMQAAGFVTDVTARVDDLDRADWYDGPWMASTIGGNIYGVPDRIDPWMIYYNKDLFEAAGVDGCPATMSKLVEDGKKLTRDGVYAWGLIGANDATLIGRYLNFLYAFGGGFLSEDGTRAIVNDEAGVAALKFYTDLLNEHGIAQPSAVGNSHGDVRQLFMTGQVAMFIDGPWARGTLAEMAPNINWSVCQIPAADGKESRFTTTSWYYTIFEPSQNKDQVWDFVRFMTEADNMAEGVVTLPARKSASQTERFRAADFEPWIAALPYGEPFPITDQFSQIAEIVGNAVQEVLAKQKSAQEAADDAAAQIDDLL